MLILPGLGGHAWALRPVADALAPSFAAAGCNWCRATDFQAIVDSIRDWRGDRPLRVVGFSGGCCIAGEIAARLEALGETPRLLVILDGQPRPPRIRLRRRLRHFLTRRSTDAIGRYIASFRALGRKRQREVNFGALQSDLTLVVSSENPVQATLCERGWRDVAAIRMLSPGVDHLELVRYPIPPEVVAAIEDVR